MTNKSSSNDLLLAEKLYINDRMTCAEIAKQIGKSRGTVEKWANRYGWKDKRSELFESRRALPQKLFEWYSLVMDGIEKALKAGKEVPASQYRLAALLFEQIPKADAVEKAASAKTGEKKINKAEVVDVVRQAVGLDESETEADEQSAV